MSYIIGVISQKGGVGKSTLARLIAREFVKNGWDVKLGDLDVQQETSLSWQKRRLENGIEPDVEVERFGSAEKAVKAAARYELMVIDGPAQASRTTHTVAASSHLVVIPTGLAVDDLRPTVLLAHELVEHAGFDPNRIAIVLSKVGDSFAEIQEARAYLQEAGYTPVDGWLPDKTGYRRAMDEGRAVTETRFSSLNAKADEVAQGVIDRLDDVINAEAA